MTLYKQLTCVTPTPTHHTCLSQSHSFHTVDVILSLSVLIFTYLHLHI